MRPNSFSLEMNVKEEEHQAFLDGMAGIDVESAMRPAPVRKCGPHRKCTRISLLLAALLALALLYRYSSWQGKRSVDLQAYPIVASNPEIQSPLGDLQSYIQMQFNPTSDVSFGQMGLFTRMYQRMLKDPSKSDEQLFEAFEQSVWSSFIPGIATLRKKHLDGRRSTLFDKGIIVPVGDANFEYALHFLATIRHVYQSNILIEIAFRDDEDLSLAHQAYIRSRFENVDMVNLLSMGLFNNTVVKMQNWAAKPYALVASKFQQAMLCDADTVLLASPDAFFAQQEYLQTGTLMFSDRSINLGTASRPFVEQQLGRQAPSDSLRNSHYWQSSTHYRGESGVVLMDKRRSHVFAASLFIAWQLQGAIREQITYRHFDGDKESFWLAFELARLPYYVNNHGAGNFGMRRKDDEPEYFCPRHPLHFFEQQTRPENGSAYDFKTIVSGQRRPLGRPAWFNGSLRRDKYNADLKGQMLNATMSFWSMDEEKWEMYEGANCQHSAEVEHVASIGVEPVLAKIVEAADKAEKEYLSHKTYSLDVGV